MNNSWLYHVYIFIHFKYFFPSLDGAVLNAPQRRLSFAVWSNLNTSAHIYIFFYEHIDIITRAAHMPSFYPWTLGPISIFRLPICLHLVLEHWVPFITRAAHNAFYESLNIGVSFQSFIKHHTYFGNIILIAQTYPFPNLSWKHHQHAKFIFQL